MNNQKMVIPNHLVGQIQKEFKNQIEELKNIEEFISMIDEMQIQFLDLSNDHQKDYCGAKNIFGQKKVPFICVNSPTGPLRDVKMANKFEGCRRGQYENQQYFLEKKNRYDIKRRIDCINAEIRTAKLLLENPPPSSILDKMIKDIREETENTESSPPRKWISIWGDECGRSCRGIKKKHGLFSKMAKWKKAENLK